MDAVIAAIKSELMPVGTLYKNTIDGTNPAILLGFGTWAAIEDVMIMAKGSIYAVDGGAGTHSHPLSNAGGVPFGLDADDTLVSRDGPTLSKSIQNYETTVWHGSRAGNITTSLGLVGDTDAGSSIPPMKVAYVWERTA